MSERLPEFNRYNFREILKSPQETKRLVEQTIEMVKNTYPER